MANHGTDPRRRMAILRERVDAMKTIWTADEASYAGEHVAFDRIWSWPKPAQRPHPPVLVGGNGPGVLDRVLAFGDAWFPNHDRGDVLDRAASLRARADRPVGLMVMGVPADAKVLEAYAEAGFERAVHWLPSAPRGPVERALGRYEAAIAEYVIVRQHERYFLARVASARRGLGEVAAMHDSDGIAAWRWWTLAEMDSTAEAIWPAGLADLIRGALG